MGNFQIPIRNGYATGRLIIERLAQSACFIVSAEMRSGLVIALLAVCRRMDAVINAVYRFLITGAYSSGKYKKIRAAVKQMFSAARRIKASTCQRV